MRHRPFAPHEEDLESALDRLSPVDFQRVAEVYAKIRFPERLSALIPIGRNATSTVKGWPDAIALDGEKVHCFEATRSDDWSGHLSDDLLQLTTYRDHIASFIFIAWAANPLDSLVRKKNQEIEALGIRSDFVFRRQFVFDLTDAQFAPVWSLLGLTGSTEPFEPIEFAPLFGGGDSAAFKASRQEYENGSVHKPALLGQVLSSLRTEHVALVQGRGASGKTSLATLAAFEPPYYERDAPHRVYYVDLTRAREEDLDSGFVTCCRAASLLIIDNVHLDPGAAARLHRMWRELHNPADLLLLGRSVETTNVLGVEPPLARLGPPLILQVEEDDLVGIYRRIVARTRRVPADPPQDAIRSWLRVFGGDLIAFSLAVTRSAGKLGPGRWELNTRDARDYILDQYLAGTTAEERETLLRIAVASEVEAFAGGSSLDIEPPPKLLTQGVVRRDRTAKEMLYSFIHPGLGTLFIAAMTAPDVSRARRLIAETSPVGGHALAYRLIQAGRSAEAAEILDIYNEPSRWLRLAGDIRLLVWNLRLVRTLELTALEQFETNALTAMTQIVEGIPRIRSTVVLGTLKVLRFMLPNLYVQIILRLGESSALETWLDSIVASDPGDLAGFLRTAHEFLSLKAMAAADTYLAGKYPQNIAVALLSGGTLGILTEIHRARLPKLVRALLGALQERADDVEAAVARLLREGGSGIATVAAMIRLFRGTDNHFAERLLALLRDPVLLGAYTRSPSQLPRFAHVLRSIGAEDALQGALAAIDADGFIAHAQPLGSSGVARVIAVLERNGRPDLAGALADHEVRTADPSRWGNDGFHLIALGQVVQSMRDASDSEIAAFLRIAASAGALEKEFERAATGPLTGFVASVWAAPRIDFDMIRTPALAEEVSRRAARAASPSLDHLQDTLRLFALCWLADLPRPEYRVGKVRHLFNTALQPSHDSGPTKIGWADSHIWIGLRDLLQFSGESLQIEFWVGEAVLDRWSRTSRTSGRLARIDVLLCEWLRACAANGWLLTPDPNVVVSASLR